MRKLLLLLTVLAFSTPIYAQDRADLYFGYQFVRTNFELETPSFAFDEATDTHGFNASLTLFPGEKPGNIGLTGELAGNFTGGEQSDSLITLMGGVTAQKRSGRAQPFLRGLVGVSRTKTANTLIEPDGTDLGLAWVAGGGLDIAVSDRVAIRLVQADYMRTRHFGASVNHLRLGVGIRF